MSLAGQTIGNYKVVQQIGEGGMGVVYLAEHPVIGRKVAIKLLHPSFAKDTETVARFFNEARAIHLIAHPNIVEILDFGQTTDGQPYFIMEYLTGESLGERIARGPVPPEEAVTIVSQICDALQAAHDKKIVHRDLKPHNVYLLAHGGRQIVKILDFGVAKMSTGWDAAQSGGQSVKTRTGSLMGTPLYMSPEQCRGSGKLDHRTDVYSLAVILFEMLSGRPPFMAEGVGELFAKHMLEPAPSLADFAPGTPAHLVQAVARALSKNLDDRFASMKDFSDALHAQPVSPPAAAGPPDKPAVAARPGAGATPLSSPRTLGPAGPSTENTTLSSMVSELDVDRELEAMGLPARRQKGPLIGAAVAIVLIAGGLLVLKKGSHPGPSSLGAGVAPPPEKTPSGEQPAARHPGGSKVTTPPPALAGSPRTVSVRFEVEPAGAHVFRRPEGKAEPGATDDLGPAPLDLKLAREGEASTFLVRAKNYKERLVKVEPARDQVLHLKLEPQSAAVAGVRPKAPPPRPVRPKRPAPIPEDEDGLKTPNF